MIAEVNPDNWQKFTVTLPIANWDDLKKVQIRLSGMPTSLAKVPRIYLDGMFVEVHYDVPPIGDESTPQAPVVVQVSPSVTVEIPPPDPAPVLPPPDLVAITKTDGTVRVTLRYLGDLFGQPLQLFVYPADTSAVRAGPEKAFNFQDDLDGQPYLNPLQISAKDLNADHEASVEVVGPAGDGQNEISSGVMTNGAYAIDVAYYNNETWLLAPLGNFNWP